MLKHIAVVLVATTLAGLAITAGASAQYHHRVHHARPLPDPVAYMRVLAPKWWGMQACARRYAVVSYSVAAINGMMVGGEADWIGPDGMNVETGNPALFHDCSLVIPANEYSSWNAIYDDWPNFCATFLHEYGHLIGRTHSVDPQSVMCPVGSDATVPAACLKSPRGDAWPNDDGPYYFNAHP